MLEKEKVRREEASNLAAAEDDNGRKTLPNPSGGVPGVGGTPSVEADETEQRAPRSKLEEGLEPEAKYHPAELEDDDISRRSRSVFARVGVLGKSDAAEKDGLHGNRGSMTAGLKCGLWSFVVLRSVDCQNDVEDGTERMECPSA